MERSSTENRAACKMERSSTGNRAACKVSAQMDRWKDHPLGIGLPLRWKRPCTGNRATHGAGKQGMSICMVYDKGIQIGRQTGSANGSNLSIIAPRQFWTYRLGNFGLSPPRHLSSVNIRILLGRFGVLEPPFYEAQDSTVRFCKQTKRKNTKMQQRKSALGRPSGTDGSDFSYRMVVDPRYTKVAQGKSRLHALIFAQAVIQVIGVLYTFLFTSKEGQDRLAISSIVVGFISLVIGELGRRRSQVNSLKVYMIASSIATLCSVACIFRNDMSLERQSGNRWKPIVVTGEYSVLLPNQGVNEPSKLGSTRNKPSLSFYFGLVEPSRALKVIQDQSGWATKRFELIEAGRALLSVPVQIFTISTTVSLIQNMSPPKRAS
ncbi:hypothetical protein HHK36_027955 [Tetracentron sinense]|uniref:Uncharacterized protein n=1 Tax=Tetracentron sinense TaxID=13715 RepID=A0A834YIM2_TETSI|nr:hypothetical protein HHK36_027955 [Tetracentron sinense]